MSQIAYTNVSDQAAILNFSAIKFGSVMKLGMNC